MANDVNISINSALNAAGIDATGQKVSQLSKTVDSSMREAAKSNRIQWANIKAAWDMGCGAIAKACQAVARGIKAIATGINSAFKFETQTMQFKMLIGSIDEAREHMQMLKELGDTPPFSLDEFAKASRSLMVMTDGALGYKKSLEMIGNAAAATGQPIETMGHAVGRLYALIRDGEPVARATMELRNMGAMSPEVCASLDDMQKAGASNAEIWGVVENALNKYNGAMAETEQTGNGLMGAIQSQWDNIVRQLGTAFMETSKNGLQFLLDKLKALQEDGTISRWAVTAKNALNSVIPIIENVAGAFNTLVSWYNKSRDFLETVGTELGAAVGTLAGGGGIKDALDSALQAKRNLDTERAEKRRQDAEDAANINSMLSNININASGDKEKDRINNQLAGAQAKKDEKAAAEAEAAAAKKSAEEAEKAAAKAAAKKAREDKEAEERAAQKERQELENGVRNKTNAEIAKVNERLDELKAIQQKQLEATTREQAGMAADAEYYSGISGNGYSYTLNSDGRINNFIDAARAERYRQRAIRDEQNAQKRNQRDANRAARLQESIDRAKRNGDKGSAISKRDQEWLERYNEWKESGGGAPGAGKSIEEEIADLQNEILSLTQCMQEDLKTIRENLGLK